MRVFVRKGKRAGNYPTLHKLECWEDMVDACLRAVMESPAVKPLATVFVRSKEGETEGVHIYYTALPDDAKQLVSEVEMEKKMGGKTGLVLGGEVIRPSQDEIEFLRGFGYEIEYL